MTLDEGRGICLHHLDRSCQGLLDPVLALLLILVTVIDDVELDHLLVVGSALLLRLDVLLQPLNDLLHIVPAVQEL